MMSRRLRRWTAFVVALPFLYVVSFGPVCRIAPLTSGNEIDPLINFYKPLLRLANASEWQWPNEALQWYGGDRAMFMTVIVLLTDTISTGSDWANEAGLASETH